jgi:hypothetical protein
MIGFDNCRHNREAEICKIGQLIILCQILIGYPVYPGYPAWVAPFPPLKIVMHTWYDGQTDAYDLNDVFSPARIGY